MTKKHFAAVAEAVRESPLDEAAKLRLAQSLADKFEEFNPNFNRARFIDAVAGRREGLLMDIKHIKPGMTVHIDVATDLWMRGVRVARVEKVGRKWVHVIHLLSGTRHRVPAQIITEVG